jgi:RNA polymerase sigma factor (sigma-70 family)
MQISGTARNTSSLKNQLDERFRAPLMAYFVRRTGSKAEAEDLTQETFVRLIGAKSLDCVEEANAYVFRVASNLLRDRARTAARWKKIAVFPLDTVPVEQMSWGLLEDREPERVLIGRESLSEVLDCLDELGERTKSIFILFRLEGMKQKDIAALYGLGVSTVEKQVMAAVMHLTRRFGPAS